EPDKGLDRADAVELAAELDGVTILDNREVVGELHAGVVILDREKERLAEPVPAAEVEGCVGERARLTADVRTVVGPRPSLARQLEPEFVELVPGHRREQRS